MKKLLLSLIALFAVLGVKAQNLQYQADWNTVGKNTSYGTYTTTDGWKAVNACLSEVTHQGTKYIAPTMNGKKGAKGTVTSPTLYTGIGKLSFCYYNPFGDKGFNVKIEVMQNGSTVASNTISNSTLGQNDVQTFEWNDINIEGEFTLKITNTSTSTKTSNTDRYAIFNLQWDGCTPAATSVANPTFTMTEGEWSHSVAMACETEGAEIRYTVDGSEPTADSELYTAPVEIFEPTVFKAVAVLDGELSNVAAFNANPPYILDGFSNLLGADQTAEVIIKAPMTVVRTYGNKAIVNCGDSYLQFSWAALPADIVAGASFSRVEGTYAVNSNNQQPEVNVSTVGAIAEGTLPQPIEAGVDQVSANNLYQYFKLLNVSISDILYRNATLTGTTEDGTTVSVPGYMQFDADAEWPLLENCNITGFVGVYKGKIQFWPTTFEGGAVTIEAPVFTPADGATAPRNSYITIEAADSTAEIWWKYGTDTDYVLYADEPAMIPANATIGATVTLQAYAKTAEAQSDVVSATYTVSKMLPNLQWVDQATNEPVSDVIFVLKKSDLGILPVIDGILEGEITFTSSNPEVAAIDLENMGIEIKGVGSTVITLAVAESAEYTADQASFTLRVTDGQGVTCTFGFDTVMPSYSYAEPTFDFVDAEHNMTFTTTARKSQSGSNWPAHNGSSNELRLYVSSENELDVEAPAGYGFRSVALVIDTNSDNSACPANINGTVSQPDAAADNGAARAAGIYANHSVTLAPDADGKQPTKITIKPEGAKGQLRMRSIAFEVAPIQTGIANIAADAQAPVEYFNLQGIRVANPANGIYIRRQGTAATKVVM